MQPVFLAVVILMILLIGFTLIILRSLAASAGVRIRSDMGRLLASYDKLIDAKNHEIHRLRREAQQLRSAAEQPHQESVPASQATPPPPALPAIATYRSAAFGGRYGTIRTHFRLNSPELTQILEEIDITPPAQSRSKAAAQLRRSLGFDSVFRLLQLASDQQLQLLDTTLSDEDWLLLRDYCQTYPERDFDTVLFCQWLEELSILEADTISIRSGDQQVSEELDLDYRPQICEGIQIASGSRIYDYSIKEREIC